MLGMDQEWIDHCLWQQMEAYPLLPLELPDDRIVLDGILRSRANKQRFEKEHFAEQVVAQSRLLLLERLAFQDLDVSAKELHVLFSLLQQAFVLQGSVCHQSIRLGSPT